MVVIINSGTVSKAWPVLPADPGYFSGVMEVDELTPSRFPSRYKTAVRNADETHHNLQKVISFCEASFPRFSNDRLAKSWSCPACLV